VSCPTVVTNTAYVICRGACGWWAQFTNLRTNSPDVVGQVVQFGRSSAGPSESRVPGVIVYPGKRCTTAWLDSSLAVSVPPGRGGRGIVATLTVTNTGCAAAKNVIPTLAVFYGSSVPITASGGPRPAGPVTLVPGAAQTFTWSFDATGGGVVRFSGSAAAMDCGCGFELGSMAELTVTINMLPSGTIDVTGGARGYINPKAGEQAVIVVYPNGAGTIQVFIYNMLGMTVRTMQKTTTGAPGAPDTLYWDGRDSSGALVPPGGYPIMVKGPGLHYTGTIGVMY
jgi:hypothetical protein